MDESGVRHAGDRFDRIAEQHVAGIAVAETLAGREKERLRVEGLDGLRTRDRLRKVLPGRGREQVARKSGRVREDVAHCDRCSSWVELRHELLDAIVE